MHVDEQFRVAGIDTPMTTQKCTILCYEKGVFRRAVGLGTWDEMKKLMARMYGYANPLFKVNEKEGKIESLALTGDDDDTFLLREPVIKAEIVVILEDAKLHGM